MHSEDKVTLSLLGRFRCLLLMLVPLIVVEVIGRDPFYIPQCGR